MATLPQYENPPVVETILGVQFEPLTGFTNAHLGAFWKRLDVNEWPLTSNAQRLPTQFEQFGNANQWGRGVRLQLTQETASRLQIKSARANAMIQLQENRLHFNWLGDSGDKYPRYETVRKEFDAAVLHLIEFIQEEQLGELNPNQWEVTYINHIPKGSVWTTPKDWGFFTPLNSVPTIDDLLVGESFAGEWHFVIPQKRGRLHIEWKHGIKSLVEDDEEQFIQLTLTARGDLTLEDSDKVVEVIREGIDLGRKTIVTSFEALMSDKANEYWR